MRRWLAIGLLAALGWAGQVSGAQADQPPQVNFATPRPAVGSVCQPVILDASRSFDPDGTLTSVAWGEANGPYGFPTYGPAAPITGDPFGQPPSIPITTTMSFAQAGNYVVGVQLTDDGGQTASAVQFLDVNPAPPAVPVPLFGQSALWQYVGQAVSFDASASYVSTFDSACHAVRDHSLSDYTWDFGDGTVVAATSAQISHVYSTPGLYTVILRVTGPDASAGPAAATHNVLAVTPPPPPAAVVGLPRGPLRLDRHGRLSVPVRCRKAKAGCVGEVLLLARKPGARAGVKASAIASVAFLIAARHVQTLRLALTATGRSWLRKAGARGLRAQLVALQINAAVPLTTATQTLTVKSLAPAPKKKRKPSQKLRPAALSWPQLRNL